MNKEQILNLFKDDVGVRCAMIAAYLADHTNPYEDRKEVFMKTPEHLYTSNSWIISLPEYEDKHGELDWFDHFYKSKHEVVDLVDICKDLSYIHDDWSEEQKDDLIKAIVNNGIHSFTLDW